MEVKMQEIIKLIVLHMQGDLSETQQKELDRWLNANPRNRDFFHQVTSREKAKEKFLIKEHINSEKAFRQFSSNIRPARIRYIRKISIYAAILILPILLSIFILIRQHEGTSRSASTETPITPGKTKAILTLAQGETIELSADQSPASLPSGLHLKGQENELIYNPSDSPKQDIQYHELATPRGGEYKITLPDGTFIHLNAGTKLKFPTRFNTSKREIFLSGEAYFEVAKDNARPFYVITNIAKIKVHGTAFNVNTLLNHQTQTTLIQGSVGIFVQGDKQEHMLKPSQQAEIDNTTKTISIREVDASSYIAWKNGVFQFDDERLESIMDKLALWYDVNVFYQNDAAKDIRFTGYLKRYDDINIILNAIETTVSASFRIKEKTIIIN
ncbi:FecR family protein [Butyricimonas synergistica]|uniref:FecR family protein n=1 Tax=Butyricimonas synergistica TaxID=544644 RepID=UPI0022E6B04D|nr:FecR domain-containing protein [Butyricimonas synergistica]